MTMRTPESSRPATPVHAPMNQFVRHQGELVVGGERLSLLAARVGQTPFYAYDRAVMLATLSTLRAAIPAGVKLHYAMKANPMPALLSWLLPRVDGVDVASAGELKLALDAGADASCISFAGPGKRASELRQAVAARVLVNIESPREVPLLHQISAELGLPARVAVRVNPDFELKSSGLRMGGGATPFGVDATLVPALLAEIGRAGLDFEGFHFYPGSQCLQASAIGEAMNNCYALALRLAQHAPAPVKLINLGGGLGIPYFPGDQRLDLAPLSDTLAQLAQRAGSDVPGASLVLELGRYLVGEAGVYVARVIDRKRSRGKVFLVTDGGLHQHLAATGNFGQVLRKNYPVAIGSPADPLVRELASVVGPSCSPLDVLADGMDLSVAQVGDLVVVFQSGAYGASASPQGFLAHPACVEVLV